MDTEEQAEELLSVEVAAFHKEQAQQDAGDAWEGAPDSADTELAEGINEVMYYEEDKGTTRDGKWDEIQCVDTNNAKVVDDVNSASSAEDERAAEISDDTEKFKKAERSEEGMPRKPVLGSCH
ncbi:hypothetical protein MRX96_024912 [Rhipicephalus microplus]